MRLARVWILGTLAGTLGAIVMYDALPGINWPLWVAVVILGLLAYRRPDVPTLRACALPLFFAVILAGGAAITTAPLLLLAIALIVASLLGLTLVLARDTTDACSYGAADILTAPIRAFAHTLGGLGSATLASLESVGAARRHPVLRGSLIAAPVVIVFALLFASADPLLARGRDIVYDALTTWGDVPRAIFAALLTLFVVGAYTASLPVISRKTPVPSTTPVRIGLTERRIVIGSAAAISWLFVLLQISYLFRVTPAATGSGVTFAEYARRGFGELAIAATAAVLLIVAAHPRASSSDEPAERSGIVAPALVLLAAVGCILVSAFHRVSLYEDAYGFTIVRMHAQVYMMLILMILVALAWRVRHAFDVRAFARDVMTVSLVTLTVLVYWNGDAWVARANLDRFARIDRLDIGYLTHGLSPDAYPTLIHALPWIPVQERAELGVALAHEYARRPSLRIDSQWYEWNFRRTRARNALLTLGSPSR